MVGNEQDKGADEGIESNSGKENKELIDEAHESGRGGDDRINNRWESCTMS